MLKRLQTVLFVSALLFGFAPRATQAQGIPAFPGAAGFGSTAIGGRGGEILFVTNLNDSGPGSLREALEKTSGPRFIVVKTSGVIQLTSRILVRNPYVTLACQTAPGLVVIKGAPLIISTHDVIIRGCRIRPADDPNVGELSTIRSGIRISSGYTGQDVYNVVIDHNSLSWAIDDNLGIWTDKVKDITVSYNIISEGLYQSIHLDENKTTWDNHSMGIAIGAPSGVSNPDRLSIHHNLLAHNGDRNPLDRGYQVEFVNNVIYNWGTGPVKVEEGIETGEKDAIIEGNWIESGSDTRGDKKERPIWMDRGLKSGTEIYHANNYSPKFNSKLDDEGNMDWCSTSNWETGCSDFLVGSPPFNRQVTPTDPFQAQTDVLASAGATAPYRDSIDSYVVLDVKNNTGSIIDCVDFCNYTDPKGKGTTGSKRVRLSNPWAQYTTESYPADADNDGIPDSWENEHGLNPNDPSDASQTAPGGYTWIEEYANGLITTARSLSRRVIDPGENAIFLPMLVNKY